MFVCNAKETGHQQLPQISVSAKDIDDLKKKKIQQQNHTAQTPPQPNTCYRFLRDAYVNTVLPSAC